MLDVTPIMYIVNEEYWIGYVLRELCKVFPRVIIADTGSTDDTITICKSFPQVALKQFHLEPLGHIVPAQQWLFAQVQTEWGFLVGGDEYYEESELLKIKELTIEDGMKVGWVSLLNLDFADGQFYVSGQQSVNRILVRGTKAVGDQHPWETIDSCMNLGPEEQKFWVYFAIQGYHVRNLSRSSRDGDAYYRLSKLDFWEKTMWEPLDRNPFVPVERWRNPYLEGMKNVATA